MSEYSGRHRPPTRAERRAQQRRTRLPKSFGPAYALPTAAAVTLVLTAAGATAAQSSPFASQAADSAKAAFVTGGSPAASATSLLSDPEVVDTARTEAETATDEADGLDQRRQAASTTVAESQGRTQERQRVARDKARKEVAADRAAAKKKRDASTSSSATTGAAGTGETTTADGESATEVGAQGWVTPLDNAVFTSPFGMRWGRLHAGQDYAAAVGTPLKAMSSGEVIGAGPMDGYGIYIDIKYWDGTVSRYGHLSSVSASVGQQVSPGDVVALSGNTGRSTGPHLHMEIHPGGGGAIDPSGWLAERGLS
ncbi:M23 family metallopeptidase [Janibacter sp. CX7]|uniref:M23 family metallopeptidase n=1 Tax=Janibacter sp. CX7 TaxID=2963431 RepID=UPI0020CE62C6|nr:M23 family metallopeptidase [Janibacter sp. CX7]UTT65401.1 M23 family metallopeptidase [Janibacter sp. CX7]